MKHFPGLADLPLLSFIHRVDEHAFVLAVVVDSKLVVLTSVDQKEMMTEVSKLLPAVPAAERRSRCLVLWAASGLRMMLSGAPYLVRAADVLAEQNDNVAVRKLWRLAREEAREPSVCPSRPFSLLPLILCVLTLAARGVSAQVSATLPENLDEFDVLRDERLSLLGADEGGSEEENEGEGEGEDEGEEEEVDDVVYDAEGEECEEDSEVSEDEESETPPTQVTRLAAAPLSARAAHL